MYRRLNIEKGYYQTPEGLEWRPCVYFRMLVYGLANLGQGRELEDLGCEEVLGGVNFAQGKTARETYCDYEGV